jgi:hypothetical protein
LVTTSYSILGWRQVCDGAPAGFRKLRAEGCSGREASNDLDRLVLQGYRLQYWEERTRLRVECSELIGQQTPAAVRQCSREGALSRSWKSWQYQSKPFSLNHAGVQQQQVVQASTYQCVATPFEQRERAVGRKRLEGLPGVALKNHLWPEPPPQSARSSDQQMHVSPAGLV